MTGFSTIAILLVAVGAVLAQDSCDGTFADTLGHPTDCQLYYNLYEMTCPEGEYYNTGVRKCLPSGAGECGQTTATSTTGTTPTTTPTTTQTTPTTTGTTTTTTGTTTATTPRTIMVEGA